MKPKKQKQPKKRKKRGFGAMSPDTVHYDAEALSYFRIINGLKQALPFFIFTGILRHETTKEKSNSFFGSAIS